MTGELSTILGHIDTISALDLDGVEPTARVVDVENVLRRRRAAPEPAARDRARAGAGHRRRGLPRAQPRRMSDLLDLTGAQAAERIAAGDVSAPELFDAYRERAGADELNAYLWVADGAPDVGRRPAGRRAAGGQGPVLHRGRAEPGGIAHPRGLPPAVHGHRRSPADRGRRRAAGQDEHGRVRDGLVERELRLRPGPEPVGHRQGARRLVGRQRRGGGGGHWRRGRSAPTPAARSASPPRCAASWASSPPTAPCRATA